MTTKEQILDAAVNAFGLGPENQEEALAFAMKVEDILDAAKGSEPVAMNLEDEARVWMEHNGMMWKGLAVSTRSTSDHELIDMPALCARFARHVLENTPAPSVSAEVLAAGDAMRHWAERVYEAACVISRQSHAVKEPFDSSSIGFLKRVKEWDAAKSKATTGNEPTPDQR